ncbi:MAG: peptidase M23 [Bacteroidetes bacterium]|nr:MAG: peptidase M23 [Bacteroidota bacterium]
MAKTKYRFNPESLQFEIVRNSVLKKSLKVLGFLFAAVMCAFIIVVLAFNYIDSPKEKQLKREISQLTLHYDILQNKLDQINSVLFDLQDRDENIYRVVFEADPIPLEVRKAGFGGISKYLDLERYSNSDLIIETSQRIDKLAKQLYIQSKSYDELYDMLRNKEDMLASIPAIQPVSNKDLKRTASGYGYRIHPIYKTRKFHMGMDFTAPTGTDIYATGNGRVEKIKWSRRGYGNHVIIDHGYGYKTLYAHMVKINVRRGQRIKRGQIIGFVGNTGTSVGPHIHYEVIKDGKRVNPINFYFNDLSPEEYVQIIEHSDRHNQSFD